ncbi:MAG TPA: glycosyl hydrolase family 8 [Polyangia bacterium]|jgi:endo-1,4-beta-D-glucanase Y
MKDPSTYGQNSASGNAMYPYPQGHAYPSCNWPKYNTDPVETAYQNWKSKFFDTSTGRIMRPDQANDTVSEGIGYGMLIGVFMNDKGLFDAVWGYGKAHLDGNGLMTWHYNSNGSSAGNGSATDADEDMAYALLMAGVQWSDGSYTSAGTSMANAIMSHEVSGNVLEGGDMFNNASEVDPSYFAPSYYRVFARVTGNNAWVDVLNESYTILAAATGSDGLVPNWSNTSGSGISSVDSKAGPYFGYDACRTPFRIALDWCLNGEQHAKDYLDKIEGFYSSTAPTSVAMLKDGYTTTGGMPPSSSGLGVNQAGMAFYGPAAVGAMEGGFDTFRDSAYFSLLGQTSGAAVSNAGIYSYFSASWGTLSLMALSGNFWDMTSP